MASSNNKKNRTGLFTVEFLGSIFALFFALSFLCLATGDSLIVYIGAKVRQFYLGALGFLSFPLLLLGVFLGLKITIGFKIENATVKRIFKYGFLYCLFISLLLQTALTPVQSSDFETYLSTCYMLGTEFSTATVGGWLMAVMIWCICTVITPIGAYVFYGVALCLISVVMLRAPISDGISERRDRKKQIKKQTEKQNKTSKISKDKQKDKAEQQDDFENFESADSEKTVKKQRTLGLDDSDFKLKSARDKKRENDKQYSLDLMFGNNGGVNQKNVYNNYDNSYTVDLRENRSYQQDYDADIESKTEYVRRPATMQGINVNSPMGYENERADLYHSASGRQMDIDLSDVEKETYVVNNGGRSRDNIPSFDRMRSEDNYSNDYQNGYKETSEQTNMFGERESNYLNRDGLFENGNAYGRDRSFNSDNSFNRDNSFSSDRYGERNSNSESGAFGSQTQNGGGRLHDYQSNARNGLAFDSNLASRASFEPDHINERGYQNSTYENSRGQDFGYGYSRNAEGYQNSRGEGNRNFEGYNGYGNNLQGLNGERNLNGNYRNVRNDFEEPEQLFNGNENKKTNGKSEEVLKKLSREGREASANKNFANRNFEGQNYQSQNGLNYGDSTRYEKTETVTNNYTERVYVPKQNEQAEINVTVNNVTENKPVNEQKTTPTQTVNSIVNSKQLSMSDLSEERQLVNPIDKMPVNYKFHFPPLKLLEDYLPDEEQVIRNRKEQERRKETIVSILNQSNINPVIEDIKTGPTITRFEISIPTDVTLKKVLEKQKDLNLWLAARDEIRIIAPIPKTTRIGIEVPNATSTIVSLKSIIASKQFRDAPNSSLICCLGKDTIGNVVLSNISEMPHLLVAGATGTGKSVYLNSMLVSLMYKYTPEELRIVIVDPKIVGFMPFKGVPHLLFDEIITEQKKALAMLEWMVKEMNERYAKFGEYLVDNIKDYNAFMAEKKCKKMFKILIIIDEFADLMASASDKKAMENKITRLAAKARAAGIHLVFAAQRPSADIVDGSIKTNFASRMAFKMAGPVDAQVVMGETGAEKLLGYGDVMHRTGKMSFTERAQGALIEKAEIKRVCDYLREHNKCFFDEFALEEINKNVAEEEVAMVEASSSSGSGVGGDAVAPRNDEEIIKQAMRIAILTNNVSGSMLQRKLGLGYPKAAKIMDQLMAKGYVGSPIDNRHREIFMDREQFKQVFGEDVDA